MPDDDLSSANGNRDSDMVNSGHYLKSRNRIGEKDSVISIVASVNCRPWRDQNGRYRYPHELWAVSL